FSEVKVGLTIPEFLLEMISQVTGPHHLRSLAMLAERFRPEECLAMGLADKIVPRENLLIESRKYLLSLSDRPLSSMRSVKENMHAGTLARIDRFLESQEDTFFQFLGANFEEGLKAVLERRRPQFTD
ncbi:MAG TPA: enoyl-CoA hydratase-related protein, partial [Leptospiraceae bacterium]|nr:enoyl-CoA hydratase-related protein [Leptospiraceae bacterium]